MMTTTCSHLMMMVDLKMPLILACLVDFLVFLDSRKVFLSCRGMLLFSCDGEKVLTCELG